MLVDAKTNQISVLDLIDGLEFENLGNIPIERQDDGSIAVPLNPKVEIIFSVQRSGDTEPGIYPLEMAAFLPDGKEYVSRHTVHANLVNSDVTRVSVTLQSMFIRESGVYTFSIFDPSNQKQLKSTSILATVVLPE